jgi:hypothetical protein
MVRECRPTITDAHVSAAPGGFLRDRRISDSRPRMIDLLACGWLVLVSGGCVLGL